MKRHLTMVVKETMDTFEITYIDYFFLRYNLLKVLDSELAEQFKMITVRQLPTEVIDNISHTDLGFFLTHSDCEGELSQYVVNVTLAGLKKIKEINPYYQESFEKLKQLFEIAKKNDSKIIYL